MHKYTFRIFRFVEPQDGDALNHREIATYEGLVTPPWVPPLGSFFRFRDPYPPGRPVDHQEVAGYVDQIVTVFYGTRMTIEVYLKDTKNP